MDIPGYVGRYQASDAGRVRSIDFFDGRRRVKGRVLRPATRSSGHLQVMLGRGTGNNWGVHQLVALAFHGPCPAGCEVLHKDLTPANNVPTNLKYGTRSENLRMDYAAGRRKSPRAWVYSNNGTRSKPHEDYETRNG